MNLTIKDVPAKLHRKLKSRASQNNRSLNWEVIDMLERAIDPQPLDIEKFLAELDAIHDRIKVPPLTDEFLREAKEWGRP